MTNTTAKHNRRQFADNRYVNSLTGNANAAKNHLSKVICRVIDAGKADVDEAVLSAKNAFKSNSVWRGMNATARARLLCKLADLIERDIEFITGLETKNNNLIFSVADNCVQQSVHCLRYIAAMCDKLYGKALPIVGPYFAFTRLEPIGVCGSVFQGISSSVIILVNQMGVALGAGNTIVIKPAEQKPFTALHLASLIFEAGFPPGVVNIVSGCYKTVCTAISDHSDIKKVSFNCSIDGLNQNNQCLSEKTKLKRVISCSICHALRKRMIELLPSIAFGYKNLDNTTTGNTVKNIIASCDKTVGTANSAHSDIVVFYCSNDGRNQNYQSVSERSKDRKQVMIEMLPTVRFADENQYLTPTMQNSIKLQTNERQIIDEQFMLDGSVKRSIELAAKRVVCYANNDNTDRLSPQIDSKHFNKIVSSIMLFTKKCILV